MAPDWNPVLTTKQSCSVDCRPRWTLILSLKEVSQVLHELGETVFVQPHIFFTSKPCHVLLAQVCCLSTGWLLVIPVSFWTNAIQCFRIASYYACIPVRETLSCLKWADDLSFSDTQGQECQCRVAPGRSGIHLCLSHCLWGRKTTANSYAVSSCISR